MTEQVIVRGPDEGRTLLVGGGDYVTYKVASAETDGGYFCFEVSTTPGFGPPLHTHDYRECFYCSRASTNSRSSATETWRSSRPVRGRSSPSRRTSRTASRTRRVRRRGCCSSTSRQVSRSSSKSSACRSRAWARCPRGSRL